MLVVGREYLVEMQEKAESKKNKKLSESILSQPQLQADKKNKQHQIRRFSDLFGRKREKGGSSSNMRSTGTVNAFRFGYSGMALSQLRSPQYDRRVATHLQGGQSIDRTMAAKHLARRAATSFTLHEICSRKVFREILIMSDSAAFWENGQCKF